MTKLSSILTAGGLAVALGFSAMQPAKADQTSTVETILGAAAVVAGVAISENVAHKQALANQIVGYTANGATVYADGHVVLPNGQSYYPSNNGQTVSCNGQRCTINGPGQTGYNNGYYGNNGYNNGYYGNNGYNNGYNTGYNNGYYNNGSAYPSSRIVRINRTATINRNIATRNVIVDRNIERNAYVRNTSVARTSAAGARVIHVNRDNANR